MKMQRITITFARDEEQRYITHLDLMRAWERILRRAGMPVARSQGFSPRPRIALAAPLAVGVTSDCELLDVLLEERRTVEEVDEAIAPHLPVGLRLVELEETPLGRSSLQSLLRAAEYVVEVEESRPIEDLQAAIAELLARDELLWEHQRGDELRRYDLRALIFDLAALALDPGRARITMRLRADEQGSGRPEQVTAALGITVPPLRIHRIRLEFDQPKAAGAVRQAAGRGADG